MHFECISRMELRTDKQMDGPKLFIQALDAPNRIFRLGNKKKNDRESNKYNIVTPAGCAWSKVSIFGATDVTSWVAWVCANYGGEPGIFVSFSVRGKVGNLWQGRSMMDSSISPDSSVGRS